MTTAIPSGFHSPDRRKSLRTERLGLPSRPACNPQHLPAGRGTAVAFGDCGRERVRSIRIAGNPSTRSGSAYRAGQPVIPSIYLSDAEARPLHPDRRKSLNTERLGLPSRPACNPQHLPAGRGSASAPSGSPQIPQHGAARLTEPDAEPPSPSAIAEGPGSVSCRQGVPCRPPSVWFPTVLRSLILTFAAKMFFMEKKFHSLQEKFHSMESGFHTMGDKFQQIGGGSASGVEPRMDPAAERSTLRGRRE